MDVLSGKYTNQAKFTLVVKIYTYKETTVDISDQVLNAINLAIETNSVKTDPVLKTELIAHLE